MLLQIPQGMVISSCAVTSIFRMMLEGMQFRAPPVAQRRNTAQLIQRRSGHRQLSRNPDVVNQAALCRNIENGGLEKPWPHSNASITKGDVNRALARPLPFQRLQEPSAKPRGHSEQSDPLEMPLHDLTNAAASPGDGPVRRVGRRRGEPCRPFGTIDLVIIATDYQTVFGSRVGKRRQKLCCRPQIASLPDLYTDGQRW